MPEHLIVDIGNYLYEFFGGRDAHLWDNQTNEELESLWERYLDHDVGPEDEYQAEVETLANMFMYP